MKREWFQIDNTYFLIIDAKKAIEGIENTENDPDAEFRPRWDRKETIKRISSIFTKPNS
ncbi:MAG: hypothetical protein GXY77_04145 [Fibrobacter sp.]|nr:hypothetical protein [Fibrobacter sp.]